MQGSLPSHRQHWITTCTLHGDCAQEGKLAQPLSRIWHYLGNGKYTNTSTTFSLPQTHVKPRIPLKKETGFVRQYWPWDLHSDVSIFFCSVLTLHMSLNWLYNPPSGHSPQSGMRGPKELPAHTSPDWLCMPCWAFLPAAGVSIRTLENMCKYKNNHCNEVWNANGWETTVISMDNEWIVNAHNEDSL